MARTQGKTKRNVSSDDTEPMNPRAGKPQRYIGTRKHSLQALQGLSNTVCSKEQTLSAMADMEKELAGKLLTMNKAGKSEEEQAREILRAVFVKIKSVKISKYVAVWLYG